MREERVGNRVGLMGARVGQRQRDVPLCKRSRLTHDCK